MIDFNRKPAEKTDAEKEYETLCEKYFEKFGVPYGIAVGLDSGTMEEIITDIRRRIARNDPQPQPGYNPKDVY